MSTIRQYLIKALQKHPEIMSISQKVYKFYESNFLVLGFILAITVALAFPYPGTVIGSVIVGKYHIRLIQFLNNCIVFLISGLGISWDDMKSIFSRRVAIIYSIIMINFITSLAAYIMIRLPFRTHEFSLGFTIFTCVPTTLGTGVSLTILASGDHVLALLLTVITNIIGIFSTTFNLKFVLGDGHKLQFSPAVLILNLTLAVFIPTVVGITIRKYSTTIATFMINHRILMNMISNTNLLMIVWMSLSNARAIIIQQSPLEFAFIVLTAICLHVFYLLLNYICTRPFHFPPRQFSAVLIMASQKASPVALAVIVGITQNISEIGLLIIPCITGQIVQIFIGSFLVKRLAAYTAESEKSSTKEGCHDSTIVAAYTAEGEKSSTKEGCHDSTIVSDITNTSNTPYIIEVKHSSGNSNSIITGGIISHNSDRSEKVHNHELNEDDKSDDEDDNNDNNNGYNSYMKRGLLTAFKFDQYKRLDIHENDMDRRNNLHNEDDDDYDDDGEFKEGPIITTTATSEVYSKASISSSTTTTTTATMMTHNSDSHSISQDRLIVSSSSDISTNYDDMNNNNNDAEDDVADLEHNNDDDCIHLIHKR